MIWCIVGRSGLISAFKKTSPDKGKTKCYRIDIFAYTFSLKYASNSFVYRIKLKTGLYFCNCLWCLLWTMSKFMAGSKHLNKKENAKQYFTPSVRENISSRVLLVYFESIICFFYAVLDFHLKHIIFIWKVKDAGLLPHISPFHFKALLDSPLWLSFDKMFLCALNISCIIYILIIFSKF